MRYELVIDCNLHHLYLQIQLPYVPNDHDVCWQLVLINMETHCNVVNKFTKSLSNLIKSQSEEVQKACAAPVPSLRT